MWRCSSYSRKSISTSTCRLCASRRWTFLATSQPRSRGTAAAPSTKLHAFFCIVISPHPLLYEHRWGKTMGTCCEDWLKQAPVPILSQATCRRPDILGSAIGDTMVCAGPLAGGIDTCQVLILFSPDALSFYSRIWGDALRHSAHEKHF